jgi:hypothetical protein
VGRVQCGAQAARSERPVRKPLSESITGELARDDENADRSWRRCGDALPRRKDTDLAARALAAIILTLWAEDARAQTPSVDPDPTRAEQLTFDLLTGAVLAPAAAGFQQWQQEPDVWPKSWSGYGRRLASEAGRVTVEATAINAIALALHERVGYVSCRCTSGVSRFGWALAAGVSSPQRDGRRRIAIGRLTGPYVGAAAQAWWTPSLGNEGGSRAKWTAINGSLSLGVNALLNVILEMRGHP